MNFSIDVEGLAKELREKGSIDFPRALLEEIVPILQKASWESYTQAYSQEDPSYKMHVFLNALTERLAAALKKPKDRNKSSFELFSKNFE